MRAMKLVIAMTASMAIVVSAASASFAATVPVTVEVSRAAARLPRTGTDVPPLVVAGSLSIASGTVVRLVARKHKEANR